jgi:N-acetylmuramoyl-L-alanine amidase
MGPVIAQTMERLNDTFWCIRVLKSLACAFSFLLVKVGDMKKVCLGPCFLRGGALLVLLLSLSGVTGCGRKAVAPQVRPAPSSLATPAAPPSSGAKVVEQCYLDTGVPQTVTHEVAPMETIWRISRIYDVPVESIYAANGIKPGNPIQIGEKLIVPNVKNFKNVIALYPNPRWKYIVIHHTATDIGKAYLIHRSHQDRGFWNGLGYHFLVDNGTLGKGDGQIEVAPRWIKQQTGAHCKAGGMNDKAIGIALVGNFSQENPTQNQMRSLTYLLKTLCSYYHIPPERIVGHRDVDGSSTECPGLRFSVGTLRQCVAGSL